MFESNIKQEKVKLTLLVPKSLVTSGKIYQLNFSQLLAKTLTAFFSKQSVDPAQLLEDVFDEQQGKRDERREFYRKRAKEFWLQVKGRRALRRNEKYMAIKQRILEKQRSPVRAWFSKEEIDFIEEEERAESVDVDGSDYEPTADEFPEED